MFSWSNNVLITIASVSTTKTAVFKKQSYFCARGLNKVFFQRTWVSERLKSKEVETNFVII